MARSHPKSSHPTKIKSEPLDSHATSRQGPDASLLPPLHVKKEEDVKIPFFTGNPQGVKKEAEEDASVPSSDVKKEEDNASVSTSKASGKKPPVLVVDTGIPGAADAAPRNVNNRPPAPTDAIFADLDSEFPPLPTTPTTQDGFFQESGGTLVFGAPRRRRTLSSQEA